MAQIKKVLDKDVVILGGGASGLMCATFIKNRQVTILEKADKIGKKILATGNGRCNLTNIHKDYSRYNDVRVKDYIERFSEIDTIEYFEKMGLVTYSDVEGRVYPRSDTANSVLDVLRLKIDSMPNVEYMCGAMVSSVEETNHKYTIHLEDMDIRCNTLVLGVGGKSGEAILDALKVDYRPYRRSLGAVRSDKNIGLNGVKVDNVEVTLEIGNKKYSQNGEILFKEDALSGIVVFNLSAYIARENVDSAYMYINLLGDYTKDSLIDILTIRKNNMKEYKIRDYFIGLFHKAIYTSILNRMGIDVDRKVSSLKDSEIITMADIITGYRVRVYDVCNNNQVYSGGVSLDNLTDKLCVKGRDGLYCMGELIDVDAECGGYNLQWAWTSGYIVGSNIDKLGK